MKCCGKNGLLCTHHRQIPPPSVHNTVHLACACLVCVYLLRRSKQRQKESGQYLSLIPNYIFSRSLGLSCVCVLISSWEAKAERTFPPASLVAYIDEKESEEELLQLSNNQQKDFFPFFEKKVVFEISLLLLDGVKGRSRRKPRFPFLWAF